MMSACPNCRIERESFGQFYIVFCPLHEAAQEMYEALEAAERYDRSIAGRAASGDVDHLSGTVAYATGIDLDELYADWEEHTKQALAAARGEKKQEPADDSEMPLGARGMSEPCGCVAVNENTRVSGVLGIRPRITFCPLHEAAQELLQALMSCRYQLGMIPHPSEDDEIAIRVTDRAIKLALSEAARGQEPADDSEMPLGPIKAPARGLGRE